MAGTHDYLAWNRARWEALRDLTQIRKIPINKIDGGFEFNRWQSSVKFKVHYNTQPDWRIGEDDYIVGLSPAKGYTEIAEVPFQKWLPPGKASILVMKKEETA